MATVPILENLGSLITFKDADGNDVSLNYLVVHEGKVYEPTFGRLDGITLEQAESHNQKLEVAMVEGVKNMKVGQKGTLYLVEKKGTEGEPVTRRVTTWRGTEVSKHIVRSVSLAGTATIYFWIGRKEYRGRERKNDQLLFFKRVK